MKIVEILARDDNEPSKAELKKLRTPNKGVRIGKGKHVFCITTGETFKTQTEAWKKYGLSPSSLCEHLRGNMEHAGRGLKFKYVD